MAYIQLYKNRGFVPDGHKVFKLKFWNSVNSLFNFSIKNITSNLIWFLSSIDAFTGRSFL